MSPALLIPRLLAAAPPAPSPGAIRPSSSGFESFTRDQIVVFVDIGIVVLAVAIVLCILRMLKGPTLVDRAIASDTIAMQVVALVILLTVRLGTLQFFDAVLIISFLGFISTVAFAQFIGRRRSAV